MPRLSTRRQWLQRTASSFGAVLLPGVAGVKSLGAAEAAPRAKAAIVLFLQGGLSHYESFDPKPDAPSDVRGEFGTIATTLPGIRFAEHLPLLAQRAHRFSLVRSAHHPTADHVQAIHITLCGCELLGANIDSRNRNVSPAMGAVVARARGTNPNGLPGYVAVPHRDQLGHRLHYGDAGTLGASLGPIDSGMLPTRSDEPFAVPQSFVLHSSAQRLQDRLDLLTRLEPAAPTHDLLRSGVQMLSRGQVARAFDINAEPLALRRRYGDHGIGQETILARRLAEAGVPFTLVNYALDQVKGQDWDTHEDNFGLMKNTLLPPMDRAVSTLLDDLQDRGLLDTTLVAILSEFGRTPRINARAGRDHWPNVFSVLLAGGGIKPGLVVGSSTRGGDLPKDRPVHIYDILATIYHQLGVRTDATYTDPAGRPMTIMPEGKPVPELI